MFKDNIVLLFSEKMKKSPDFKAVKKAPLLIFFSVYI